MTRFTRRGSTGVLKKSIAVAAHSSACAAHARKLALELNLPLLEPGQQYQLLLNCTENGLELIKSGDPGLTGPIRVDFTTGHSKFRRQQQKQELLVRAVGVKGDHVPTVLDGTGGLGRDSFILATAGCQVQVYERQPIIAALLADGLNRALDHPDTSVIARRIRLIKGDALVALREMHEQGRRVDVIYLDPMFPERQKSARVKKESQVLQMLAAEDPAPERLLAAALDTSANRVVVKRPRKAPFLAGRSPSHSLTGKTIRFDVYMIHPDK